MGGCERWGDGGEVYYDVMIDMRFGVYTGLGSASLMCGGVVDVVAIDWKSV